MTHIDTLLSRTSPLTETEAILLAAECGMLLERAKLCAAASALNTRFRVADMDGMNLAILAALDEMPNLDHWEEEVAIAREIGE